MVDPVTGKLLRAGLDQDEVALQASVDNLADDVLVGEADDQTVLRRVAKERFSNLSRGVQSYDTYYLFLAWVIRRLRA